MRNGVFIPSDGGPIEYSRHVSRLTRLRRFLARLWDRLRGPVSFLVIVLVLADMMVRIWEG